MIYLVAFGLLINAVSAQFLGNQQLEKPPTPFNDSTYLKGTGGYQEVLYEDVTSLGPPTDLVALFIQLEPCGMYLPQFHPGKTEITYIMTGTVYGALIDTNNENQFAGISFGPGGVFAVPAGALHYAENIGCTTANIFQVQSGGPNYTHVDIFTSLFDLSPSSVEYGMNISAAQVVATANYVQPIFALNQACLSKCGLAK